MSRSDDSSLIIYSKDSNNKYTKDYKITTNGPCCCIIETKENEICYDGESCNYFDHSIYFYDLLGQKFIKRIDKIYCKSFNMIAEDLLLITGKEKLYIINVKPYNLIRINKCFWLTFYINFVIK